MSTKIYEGLSKIIKGFSKSDAEKVLAKIDTPEKAVALTGDARAEYLKALEVVHGPTDARAASMGFGKQDWYHGTTVPIDKFEDSAKGLSTGAQSAKKGFFFAQDPSTASDYAELAREKGIIREGDKVTTRWLSDAPEPAKVGFSEVDDKKRQYFDLLSASRRENKRLEVIKEWEKFKKSPPDWLIQSAKREGKSIEQFIAEKTVRIKEKIPLPTKKEINAAKAEYLKTAKEFAATNDPEYVQKIAAIDLDSKNPLSKDYQKAISLGIDAQYSAGQNVLPVKLRAQNMTQPVHVKDYKGQGYRDTTYADEMTRAQEKGASGVLFKNTYDAADPNNKIKQNIAAVFSPEQIRSKFAAFDPRFKNSPLLMAGAAGAALTMLPEESEASMSGYKGLKNVMKIGDSLVHTTPDGSKTIVKHPMNPKPANITSGEGNSLQLANEVVFGAPKEYNPNMGKAGRQTLDDTKATLERSMDDTQVMEPVIDPSLKKKTGAMAVPALNSSDMMNKSWDDVKEVARLYRENVSQPIANKLKQTFTPDVQAGSQTYQTSSPVSDMALDVAGDPLTYAAGGAGVALGALDMATGMSDEPEKRNYNSLKSFLNKK